MENPATWGEAERVVHTVLNENIGGRVGLSVERRITDALRGAGLLAVEYEEVGWLVDEEDEFYFVGPDDDGKPGVYLPDSARSVFRKVER